MKRSHRRHHKRRMQARAHSVYNVFRRSRWDKAWQHGDHIKVCSCDGCGNPRHQPWTKGDDRYTLQERRAMQDPVECQ